MTRLMIAGVGPHARRFYLPALAARRADLATAVELEAGRDAARRALSANGLAAEVVTVPRFEHEMPTEARAALDAAADRLRPAALIIATDPLSHRPYVLWALRRGMHVLLDKPVTARRDAVNSLAAARGIVADLDELLAAWRETRQRRPVVVSVCAHRRYHPGIEEALKVVADACRRTGCPVTDVHAHDAFGNRISTTVTENGTTTTTTHSVFVAVGLPRVGADLTHWRLWADLSSSNVVETRYLSGEAANEWQGRVETTGTRWLYTDRLGSIRLVANDAGAVIDTVDYDAFGVITYESVPGMTGRLGYAGYEVDAWAGMNRAGARYYEAATGRFFTRDPLGLAPDSNPYRYVGNSPTNETDPSGLISPTVQLLLAQAVADTALSGERVIANQAAVNKRERLSYGAPEGDSGSEWRAFLIREFESARANGRVDHEDIPRVQRQVDRVRGGTLTSAEQVDALLLVGYLREQKRKPEFLTPDPRRTAAPVFIQPRSHYLTDVDRSSHNIPPIDTIKNADPVEVWAQQHNARWRHNLDRQGEYVRSFYPDNVYEWWKDPVTNTGSMAASVPVMFYYTIGNGLDLLGHPLTDGLGWATSVAPGAVRAGKMAFGAGARSSLPDYYGPLPIARRATGRNQFVLSEGGARKTSGLHYRPRQQMPESRNDGVPVNVTRNNQPIPPLAEDRLALPEAMTIDQLLNGHYQAPGRKGVTITE